MPILNNMVTNIPGVYANNEYSSRMPLSVVLNSLGPHPGRFLNNLPNKFVDGTTFYGNAPGKWLYNAPNINRFNAQYIPSPPIKTPYSELRAQPGAEKYVNNTVKSPKKSNEVTQHTNKVYLPSNTELRAGPYVPPGPKKQPQMSTLTSLPTTFKDRVSSLLGMSKYFNNGTSVSRHFNNDNIVRILDKAKNTNYNISKYEWFRYLRNLPQNLNNNVGPLASLTTPTSKNIAKKHPNKSSNSSLMDTYYNTLSDYTSEAKNIYTDFGKKHPYVAYGVAPGVLGALATMYMMRRGHLSELNNMRNIYQAYWNLPWYKRMFTAPPIV